MWLRAVFVALLFANGATAAPNGHCMALSAAGGCSTAAYKDKNGVIKPGLHVYFSQPTARYDHGILGDAQEWGSLIYMQQGSPGHGPYIFEELTLPLSRVFEDLAPRLADLDGDGVAEIIVIETHVNKGAQLAIYGFDGERLRKITATPHIGRTHRWLAPIGVADLDGDGAVEIAYIDRPHLARLLKIWRYQDGELTLVGQQGGLSNHNIGDDYISGGLRDCGDGVQMITSTADWQNIVASQFVAGEIKSVIIGKNNGRRSFERALGCRM